MQDAHGIAAQGGQGGVSTAALVVAAAPIPLVLPPSGDVPGEAMVLHAAAALLRTAPRLLGVRPSLQPVAKARIAIVDLPCGLATRDGLGHVQRPMAMGCTRAPPVPETKRT